MKRIFLLFSIVVFSLSSCNKDEEHSYEYWSRLVSEKYTEINTLTQSVDCTDINDFEIVNRNGYHLVHPSIKARFEQLMNELDHLQTEASKAASREGIIMDWIDEPNPPLRKECADGKPKLIYAQNLSLEEINEEIPARYEEIKNFYNDVPCTNADEWVSHFLRVGCCHEGIALHKTIRSMEFYEKIQIFNRLNEVKLSLEKTSCLGSDCARFAKPVQCVDGRPVVELTRE